MRFTKLSGVLLALVGLALSLPGGAQQAASVSIAITSPADGYVTVSSEIEIQGTVAIERAGTEVFMVIVSVNGEAQQVPLEEDGIFRARAALELGRNLISAIVTTQDKELASTKITVTRQNPILFFDDFEGREPRPEWAPASGTWVIERDEEFGRVLTLKEKEWDYDVYIYVKTSDSLQWRDYAVEVNAYHAATTAGMGIVVRARDDQNKVVLYNNYDRKLCWFVVKDGKQSSCIGTVTPGLRDQQQLRIEVRGNEFIAYVNGVKRLTFIDEKEEFTEGMPGLYLWYRRGASFDNFKVISLAPGTPEPISQAPPPTETPEKPEELSPPTGTASVPSAELQDLKERLTTLESTVGTLRTRVGDHQSRLGSLETRVGAWGQDIASLRTTVATLREEHSGFASRLQGLSDRVQALEARPAEMPTDLEARLQAIQQSLTTLAQTAEQSRAEVEALRRDIQAVRQETDQAKNSAQLGLIAGAVGAGLALLIGLRIFL